MKRPDPLKRLTIRARLTVLYGGLFFAAGAVLIVLLYLLMRQTMDNRDGRIPENVDLRSLDEILPEGLLVYTEDKYGNREEATSDAENYLSLPMTVLVNGNSASASEIFAGAVKDYHWATLVGTTTYGKGIVQRIFDLGDGTAAKITISKYYTPAGNNIHGIGIEPDVEVEIPTEAYDDGVVTEDEDAQLQKALELLRSGQVTAGEVQQ